jgi:H+/Na+-translocating ferredoxin:NAD+ oxidoreductase subunit D
MPATSSRLILTTAPFVREERTTSRIMREVLFALVPVLLAAWWTFGLSALLVTATATVGAVGTEWLMMRGRGTLSDNSALLTGVLLGLTLPPGLPLWMALLGGVVGMGLGKLIWGGLGGNVFNPALVGRAFLQAAFPVPITTWVAPHPGLWTIYPQNLAWPLMSAPGVDVISEATPLGLAKFEGQITDLWSLFIGNTGGSLGETSALVLLLVGLVLVWRRVFDWRLPVATLLSVALFGTLFYLIDSSAYPPPWFLLTSGGLLFGAVFMVTDPVTTPITVRGAWIFGAGVGVLVVMIRLFGGLPEGVMYAILLMNSVTPMINRATQPRRFGG